MTNLEKQISEFIQTMSTSDDMFDKIPTPRIGYADIELEAPNLINDCQYNFDTLRIRFRAHYSEGFTYRGDEEMPTGYPSLAGLTEIKIWVDNKSVYSLALRDEFEVIMCDIINSKFNLV